MRPAIVDQIILWIVLFVSFATIFYMVIDYSTVIRVQDKSDALASYGARMKALGKEDNIIVNGLNIQRGNYFDTIVADDLTCSTNSAATNYQVIFTTNISIVNTFIDANERIYAISTAFNETSDDEVQCTLNLRLP